MKIQLINGQFTANETIDLLSQLVRVKIKFLEDKISTLNHEEDIKSKEAKIIRLQNMMSVLRQQIGLQNNVVHIASEIELNF